MAEAEVELLQVLPVALHELNHALVVEEIAAFDKGVIYLSEVIIVWANLCC